MNLQRYFEKEFEDLELEQSTKNIEFYKNPGSAYIDPFKIAGNLYYVGDKKVCAHLIDTGDGLILFDSGFQHTIHMLIHSIWKLGFNPEDVKYIIHSHEHFDHIGAANEFKILFGTKNVISKAGADIFKNREDLVFLDANPNQHAYTFTPDIELEDGEIFTLGNTSIKCVLTPGHSHGVMSFFFNINEGDRVYKVGYFGGVGFNTLYKKSIEKNNIKEPMQQIFSQSIDKVRNEKVDIVLGNHPAQNNTLQKRKEMIENKNKNPFINSSEWHEFICELENGYNKFLAMGK